MRKANGNTRFLRDLVEVASGQVDPTIEPYASLPHVGGENIESVTGRIIGVKTARQLGLTSGKYVFGPGDILYSKIRPNLNKVSVLDFAGICSADIYPLRARSDAVCAAYLAHLLRSEGFLAYSEKHSSRTNIPKLNRDSLLAFETPLPPLAEQRRIADLLDRAEALRARRRAALSEVDALPRAIFLKLFGDTTTSGRHPCVGLAECAEVVSGVAKGRKLDGRGAVEVPYLRVANVQAGYLDLSEVKTIEALPSEVADLALEAGDVLLTEGGDFDKLGRGALFEGQMDGCIHQNHVFRVRTDASKLLPGYFHEYLQAPTARAYFLRCAKRTTNLASINMTQLRSLPVPLPPISLQREFSRRVAAVETLKGVQRASLAELDALFASLQHRAFRGEL